MTEVRANVIISYERFLECQARRRGIVSEPTPHDHSPTSETHGAQERNVEAAAAQPPARPAPRAGG